MLEILSQSETWISLLTLTMMEIVLGIDNVIFISIVTSRLPEEQQARARFIGLVLALVIRVLLLFAISWIIGLVYPVITLWGNEISWRDIILLAGGLFLITKSTTEIHHKIEGEKESSIKKKSPGFWNTVSQVLLLDVVFSFDSIITAVGLADHVEIMIAAVIISMIIMIMAAGTISDFINRHPTMKMLALSFLLMIGLLLVAEAFDVHVPKGYVYFAMTFSIIVEALNMRVRKHQKK